MKCLFCTSEALPFAVSGGLGEVAGSLPRALRQRLVGCRVVLPLYDEIPQNLKESMKFIANFEVPVSWRKQYCGVFEARAGGIIYYLVDNEFYFKRRGLYGHFDDAERFAFFSRAVLEMLPHINFKPDVIHCNDWQTALVPVYFSLFYSKEEWYSSMKTIFTIHNIQYQGKYGYDILGDIVGIPDEKKSIVDFDGCVNFMKGAIETANRVTTVSPTYANEIMQPWYSYGLDPILRARAWKVRGILNGINVADYNPVTDPDIYKNYSVNDLNDKIFNKTQLQKRLNLEQNECVPLIGMVTRMVEHKGLDLIKLGIKRLLDEDNIQFVILGSGDKAYEEFFRDLQDRYPGRVCACFGFVPELSRKIYAGSDIFLMPSKTEPCGLSQMIALRYGTIPVVRETGGLNDSISDSADGKGVGFRFSQYDVDDMVRAIKRAISGYSDSEGWCILMERAMRSDNSWSKSANEYIKLYREVIKENQ